MSWIDKNENWLPRNSPAVQRSREIIYTITEVATLLKVSRNTVYKWLAFDAPEEAVIPPDMWFKLPTGHLRIRRAAVDTLLQQTNKT